MKLVVVESPGKVSKLSSILGSDYKVVASIGHCIDLPKNKLGVNIKKNFEPTYTVIPEKKQIIDNIIKLAQTAECCILSSDPDREGEFISYIISTQLPKNTKFSRVTFNSITKNEVLNGMANPRNIDMNLVNAQQSRRILDRLCGYKTSPVAQQFIAGARSAGRVQSAVLRLIVEREEEITNFKPEEYWDINGEFDLPLKVELKKPQFGTRKETDLPSTKLDEFKKYCLMTVFTVSDVEVTESKNNANAPFTTSSLQQAASSLFGWGAKKTMGVAQQLYNSGRISYHRTDAVTLSPEFLREVRTYVKELGEEYLPSTPLTYKSKVACAQEAHEACRVTHIEDSKFGSDDEGKLYELIWRRSIASQMNPAIYVKTKVIITDLKDVVFESHTKVQKFDGHLKIWTYSQPSIEIAPRVEKNQKCRLLQLNAEQKFTNPPARYTDGGSLTKKLEELGIGRPATLAGMSTLLLDRGYATKESNSLAPTPLGQALIKFLKERAFSFIDLTYTAKMEEELDEISNGNKSKLDTLKMFWADLEVELKKSIESASETPYKNPCPTCGNKLIAKHGRFGPYVKCTIETCNYKASLTLDGNIKPKTDVIEYGICPKCNKKTYLKSGRFGQFVACEDYLPKQKGKCNYTLQLTKEGTPYEKKQAEVVEGISCPKCSKAIVKRKGRFGDFLSCSGYPKCRTIVNPDGSIKIRKGRGRKKKEN